MMTRDLKELIFAMFLYLLPMAAFVFCCSMMVSCQENADNVKRELYRMQQEQGQRIGCDSVGGVKP